MDWDSSGYKMVVLRIPRRLHQFQPQGSRVLHDGHLHPFVAVILASISGFLMVNAGVAFSEGGWGSARPFALGGGIAI